MFMVGFRHDSTLHNLNYNNMKNLIRTINNTFWIGLGIMIGFLFSNLISVPGQFSPVAWAALIGIIGSMISIFIDFIIQPGQIFGFYSKFLTWMNRDRNMLRVFYKPMGGCLYCMNVWVIAATFTAMKTVVSISWWWLFASAAIGHVSLSIVERKINS